MKKAALFPLLALSLLTLPACGESVPNQDAVNAVKALLAKQDLSPCYHKIFSAHFTQDYDVFSSIHDGDRHATQFHSYHGGGAFGCAYMVSKASYEEAIKQKDHDFFDFLSRGRGGYGLLQGARVSSFYDETEGDERQTEPPQQENFLQNIQVNFGETDVQVYSSLTYSEGSDGSNTRFQSFNGLLGKETLFNSISVRALSDLFARTNLYDGQRSCEVIDGIYESTLRGLQGKSDKELSDFIQKNHITFGEDAKNTLVHFEVGDESIRAALTEADVIPGVLKGTLSYDKGSGAYTGFEYRVSNLESVTDPDHGRVYSASMEFTAVGYSNNEEFEGDIYITPNPTVYEDGNLFVNDMIAGIIPDIH